MKDVNKDILSCNKKLARHIRQANGSFNPKQRSKYLGEMLYNNIIIFFNVDNIVVEI